MAGHDPTDSLERLVNLGHLSSAVGHNVINAFSAIVSHAELLRIDPSLPSPTDPAALAETIIRSALEASTVARRLIDYTRPITSIEPASAAGEPRTIALDQLVTEVVAAEQTQHRKGITWELDLSPTTSFRGDPTQIRSMLSLLLRNAYEAIPLDGGSVRISTSLDRRGWNVLEIVDSGSGKDAQTLERAVEPFFSTKPGHLGIGLSIANGVWRRHKGTLSIQSESSKGTSVRLCVEPSRDAARAAARSGSIS
jgi:signal transduction histidine kinase